MPRLLDQRAERLLALLCGFVSGVLIGGVVGWRRMVVVGDLAVFAPKRAGVAVPGPIVLHNRAIR